LNDRAQSWDLQADGQYYKRSGTRGDFQEGVQMHLLNQLATVRYSS